MRNSQRLFHVKNAAQQLLSCKYPGDLAALLEIPEHQLSLLAANPQYHTFTVPKQDGSRRLIEAPEPALKANLKRLNYFLQCVYFFIKPNAAYGYVLTPKYSNKPRNILTNAERHLNQPHMLNIDFQDFFHQIAILKVETIFKNPPFHLHEDSVTLLANLCCYMDRLPMGSPASPVLSNFATIPLDNHLEKWCKTRELVYTRFVDDLTFSGKKKFNENLVGEITTTCESFGFFINPEKTKIYGKIDTKVVTGLEVTHKVSIPGSFYYELSQELKRLKITMETFDTIEGSKKIPSFMEKLKQQVEGKVNFLGMIMGTGNLKFQRYQQKLDEALAPDTAPLALRWMDFPYSPE